MPGPTRYNGGLNIRSGQWHRTLTEEERNHMAEKTKSAEEQARERKEGERKQAQDRLKEKMTAFLQAECCIESPQITITNLRFRECFFDQTDQAFYDRIMEKFEDIEFDYKRVLLHAHPVSDLIKGFTIDDVPFISDEVTDWEDEEEGVNLADRLILAEMDETDLTLEKLEEWFPGPPFERLMERIELVIEEDLTWNDLTEYLDILWGISDAGDIYHEPLEALGYWTTYFECDRMYWKESVAYRVGLTPFTYDGANYLALGGCGMDLSPKLDAFQALTTGSIPSGSMFLSDPNYARHVVGGEIFLEVLEKIQDDYVIHINTGSKELLYPYGPVKSAEEGGE